MTRATHAAPRGRLRLRRAAVRSVEARADLAAFEAVYRDSHQELYRYARSIVRDEHLAEDVLQSVMEKALAALQTEERDFEVRPWLFRITHNEAVSRLRGDRPTAELPEALPGNSRGLDEQLDDQSKLDTLWVDLQALPEKQRQSLVLRELSGLSHEEIAAVIGSSARSVKQTIFEARRALLECEEGRVMVCDDVQRQLSDGDGRVRRGRRMQAHLRSCRDCRAFDRAMHDRPQDLRALAPALPAAAAAGLFAQLVPGAGLASSAGAAGAAGAGGLAASGGWSLGALGSALATKTAVVAATTVAAVGATGAVVAERAQGPVRTAAPAAGAGAPAGGAAKASGSGAPGAGGAAATTPGGADRRAGAPSTTPNAAPRGATPGSAQGQERRAAGQARAADARTEARERKASKTDPGSGGKHPKAAERSPGSSAKTTKAKSSTGPSKAKSSAPKSSPAPKTPKSSPAPAPGERPTRDSGVAPKSPAADAAPKTGDPSSGNSGEAPPDQAASGTSRKPEK